MDQATVANRRGLWTIVLAAGASSRLGRPKQLLRRQSVTLLRRTFALARAVSGSRVIVVIGAERMRMQSHLRRINAKAQIAFNKSWPQGMGTSLAAGIHALPPGAVAALILLCDQPEIEMKSLQRLCGAGRRHNSIIASRYNGRCGVPAIFPRKIFAQLRQLSGDRGAREFLNAQESEYRIVSVAMPEAALDIDTIETAKAASLSGS